MRYFNQGLNWSMLVDDVSWAVQADRDPETAIEVLKDDAHHSKIDYVNSLFVNATPAPVSAAPREGCDPEKRKAFLRHFREYWKDSATLPDHMGLSFCYTPWSHRNPWTLVYPRQEEYYVDSSVISWCKAHSRHGRKQCHECGTVLGFQRPEGPALYDPGWSSVNSEEQLW
jgi:hypothetical protein